MTHFLDSMVQNTALYSIISLIINLFVVISAVMGTVCLFNIKARKKIPYIIACGVTVAVCTALEVYDNITASDSALTSLIVLLMPFICILIEFPIKQVWKGIAVSFAYNIAEALKYLILMVVFEYDGETAMPGPELFADFVVNLLLFVLIMGLYIASGRKGGRVYSVTKIKLPLYLLIVATTVVFISTMINFGINFSAERRYDFILTFLNVPLFAATIVYAVTDILKTRISEENYKTQLDMQVRSYEMLEKKDQDMRVLRHDLPKKLRPLSVFIAEGKNDEAQQILSDFSVAMENTRPRYQTGNFRLDTVLECQQQIAEKDGINIVFPFNCSFPESGIAPDDIYTIFPNALDNAIESCRKAGGNCEIKFTSKIMGDTVLITISNPAPEALNIKNGKVATSKQDKDNHGYGLGSIKKAAAKYGRDNVDFKMEDGIFTLRADLKFR